MVTTTRDVFIPIEDASSQFEIEQSLIEAWVANGDVRASGAPASLNVNRDDLARKIAFHDAAVTSSSLNGMRRVTNDDHLRRKLTPEEIEAALAALGRGSKIRERLLADRGGELFPPSWEIIRAFRDER